MPTIREIIISVSKKQNVHDAFSNGVKLLNEYISKTNLQDCEFLDQSIQNILLNVNNVVRPRSANKTFNFDSDIHGISVSVITAALTYFTLKEYKNSNQNQVRKQTLYFSNREYLIAGESLMEILGVSKKYEYKISNRPTSNIVGNNPLFFGYINGSKYPRLIINGHQVLYPGVDNRHISKSEPINNFIFEDILSVFLYNSGYLRDVISIFETLNISDNSHTNSNIKQNDSNEVVKSKLTNDCESLIGYLNKNTLNSGELRIKITDDFSLVYSSNLKNKLIAFLQLLTSNNQNIEETIKYSQYFNITKKLGCRERYASNLFSKLVALSGKPIKNVNDNFLKSIEDARSLINEVGNNKPDFRRIDTLINSILNVDKEINYFNDLDLSDGKILIPIVERDFFDKNKVEKVLSNISLDIKKQIINDWNVYKKFNYTHTISLVSIMENFNQFKNYLGETEYIAFRDEIKKYYNSKSDNKSTVIPNIFVSNNNVVNVKKLSDCVVTELGRLNYISFVGYYLKFLVSPLTGKKIKLFGDL